MASLVPVILAGGSGTRLWPLSRQQFPKQFLKLFGDTTMFQQTIERLDGIPDLADPIVVCNNDHRFTVAEQLQEIGRNSTIILEPVARNTAPAITLAALQAKKLYDNPTLLVLAADHLIKDQQAFHQAIATAVESATEGSLVTFGIVPNRPETGYGYIKAAAAKKQRNVGLKAEQFVEKPDQKTAESYLADGNYYWNSGMFVFGADAFLAQLQKQSPDCFSAAEKSLELAKTDMDFLRVGEAAFASAPNISIDYAVMEKSSDVVCVPLDAGWSDVGCWRSYWEAKEKDENGNSFVGDAKAIATKDTLVYSQDKLVFTVGVENLVVVNTADAVLVIDKKHAQHVKEAIQILNDDGRNEHITHREVHRPWGSYDSIDVGDRFQVKRICVKPGGSLSLQMHHHRAEHWTVVKGTAKVECGETELILTENQSTYIPLGTKHRLSNPGKMILELVEVQSGAYLGEDDIVRFEDTYGRR